MLLPLARMATQKQKELSANTVNMMLFWEKFVKITEFMSLFSEQTITALV